MAHTPCQVKSSAYHLGKNALPKGGFLIDGHHVYNMHRFRGAEYVVREVNATLSAADRHQFDRHHDNFLKYVDGKLGLSADSH